MLKRKCARHQLVNKNTRTEPAAAARLPDPDPYSGIFSLATRTRANVKLDHYESRTREKQPRQPTTGPVSSQTHAHVAVAIAPL